MRLLEVRLLEGPNLYRLEPTVKVEVTVGRRRTWYGQRLPGAHAVVGLGRPVPAREVPPSIRDLRAWVRRLHRLTGAAAWLATERGPDGRPRRILAITVHRTSEPGHWIVAFPWREHERALELAEAAWYLTERGLDPRTTRLGRSRTLTRALARIRAAGTTPPAWITDDRRHMPLVSISGTNGKSTTTRMIAAIVRAAGHRVGVTTSDGVLIDGHMIDPGDWTGPAGAKQILERSDVEIAVLETARGGILLRGVGYASNDVSVLTNVSSDHLDLQGIHTLPELAEVKATIARITRVEGMVVLNADDPLIAALARRVRAPVTYFSLRGTTMPLVRRHLARGGRALVAERGWIVEAEGQARRPVLAIAEAPATLYGLAAHNVANALAAVAAARSLGVTIKQAAAGLRAFRPTAEDAPGRLNLYRLGNRVVIVDFAHNEAGVSVLLDVAEGIAGGAAERARPVTIIIGTAGDRPDDTLRGIGRIAGERASHVVIKETLAYLRGRSRGSVVGEFRAGLAEAGVRAGDVPVHENETAALRAVLANGGRSGADEPGVIVLMCHEDRGGVQELLADLGARPIDLGADLLELVPRLQARPYRAR